MKTPKIHLLILCAILLSFGAAACRQKTATFTPMPTLEPGDHERTLTVKDKPRSYLLHVPPGMDNLHPVPVLLGFHGYGSTAANFRSITGFNAVADANNFLAVYPQGDSGDNSWNAGGCCTRYPSNAADDIAFIRQTIADLRTIANIDPQRIYATGHSNGAMFVYRLACEMPDTFAAIAPVAGPLYYSPCKPPEPVSVLHIHGLADLSVPFAGGPLGGDSGVNFPSATYSIDAWVKLDSCTGEAQVDEQGAVTHTAYTSCKAGAAVELYAIEGLAHIWPQPDAWPASETIWEFFAAHPKP
jgi:polyhydroxybutyrate depolymerase